MKKGYLLSILCLLNAFFAFAQEVKVGERYSLNKLSQESVQITQTPMPHAPKEVGDTTFTLYTNSSLDIKTYLLRPSTNRDQL